MHILRRITSCPTNHDLLTVIVPLQDRARADAEFPANLGRHRDLTLCGELRMSDRHARYITMVMNTSRLVSGPARDLVFGLRRPFPEPADNGRTSVTSPV